MNIPVICAIPIVFALQDKCTYYCNKYNKMKQYNFEKLYKHQHSDTNIHGVILGNDYNYQNIELTSAMYKYTNTDLKKNV